MDWRRWDSGTWEGIKPKVGVGDIISDGRGFYWYVYIYSKGPMSRDPLFRGRTESLEEAQREVEDVLELVDKVE